MKGRVNVCHVCQGKGGGHISYRDGDERGGGICYRDSNEGGHLVVVIVLSMITQQKTIWMLLVFHGGGRSKAILHGGVISC